MTEIEEYISNKQELYNFILSFIEDEESEENNIDIFRDLIEEQKICENVEDMRIIIRLLVSISNNHQRNSNFFDRIEQILSILSKSIKQTYSNTEIFNLFKSNDRLLLFLFKKEIMHLDQSITDLILYSDHSKRYFFNEIKPFITEKKKRIIGRGLLKRDLHIFENFDEKREKGENESYICSLIRDDSVEEFIAYVNRNVISLKSKINSSIFETNSFLIENEPTLIEYAAFFGSIQIFNFLKFSGVELNPSLWLYAIHSNNADLIHMIENDVIPTDETFERCLEESIKCHHNEIAKYIINNLLDNDVEESNQEKDFYRNTICYGYHYYNFEFITNDLSNKFIFHYLCKYDYFILIKLLLQKQRKILNSVIILRNEIYRIL